MINYKFFQSAKLTTLLEVIIFLFLFTGYSTASVIGVKLNDFPDNLSRNVGDFSVSADSKRIIFFVYDVDGILKLYSAPIDGGDITLLNDPPASEGNSVNYSDVSISPDSSLVVFMASEEFGIYELYSAPIDGGSAIKLNGALFESGISGPVFDGSVSEFLISDDSSKVVYRADQDTNSLYELYSVPIDGGTVTKLNNTFASDEDIYERGFSISPDSKRVVYMLDRDSVDVRELYSVPINGGPVSKLNPPIVSGGTVYDFLITPDSKYVVYWADQDTEDVIELYSVPIEGGAIIKLNVPFSYDQSIFRVFISPDSRNVVYVADQDTDKVYELYSVPINGGIVTKLNIPLSSDGEIRYDLSISPDSERVVYIAKKSINDSYELYSVSIEGGDSTRLNNPLVSGGSILDFSISPDSKLVVYRADQDTDGVLELYSIPIGGGTAVKLNGSFASYGGIYSFTISPDSNWVVYRAVQDTKRVYELYCVPIDGGVVSRLNNPLVSGGEVYLIYMISKDSSHVIFREQHDTSSTRNLYSSGFDSDNDGVTDSDEINVYYTDPYNADSDDDGMPDGWEILYDLDPLVNNAVEDKDGDGYTDIEEYNADTNPDNVPPVAVAGNNKKAVDGLTITLNASGSFDADDEITSYLWSQLSGPPVALWYWTTMSPTFTVSNVAQEYKTLVFQLTVTDSYGQQSIDTCTVNVVPDSKVQVLELNNNWNLISINRQASDETINKILKPIEGEYLSIWSYQNNLWGVYDPENTHFSDLQIMQTRNGYWLNMNKETTLCLDGTKSTESIELTAGWNLVGFQSSEILTTSHAIESILSNVISIWAYKGNKWYVYDTESPAFSDLNTMLPGYGYWINVKQNCAWVLPK